MGKINTIDNSRFGNENYLSLCRELETMIERFEVVGQRFGYLTTAYKAAVARLDLAMRQPTWSELSEPIRLKDEALDKVVIALKALVESNSYYSVTEGGTAAAEKIKRYVSLNKLNPSAQYDKELAQVSNFVQDMKTYCQAEVTLLGLEPLLTQMKTLGEEMAKLLADRDIEDSLKHTEAVKNARREVESLYVALRETVNGAALVDAEGTLTAFINAVNQALKRHETQVLSRKNRKPGSTTDGEETDEEVTEEEETEEEETEEEETEEKPGAGEGAGEEKPGEEQKPGSGSSGDKDEDYGII